MTNTNINIVVVEDNELLREEMVSFLTRPGWQAHGVDCGEALNDWLQQNTPHIAVLDVNLPYEDGYSIANRLRSSYPAVGIVMLSARVLRGERAAGYQSGADVYLTKPTSTAELISVIENLARRLPVEAPERELALKLCRATGVLQTQQGVSCQLTATETRLIELLALAPQQLADTAYVLAQLSLGKSGEVSKDAFAVALTRLRQKCKQALAVDNIVVAHRGIGYRLSVPVELN